MQGQTARNDNIPVALTVTTISEPNPSRKMIYLKNTSVAGEIITICYGDNPVANEGVQLVQGATVIEVDSDNFDCWRGKITCLATVATATLAIMERM